MKRLSIVLVGEMHHILMSFSKYIAIFAEIILSWSSLEFLFIDEDIHRREESRGATRISLVS